MRYVILKVSPHFLVDMCRIGESHTKVIEGLPPDTRFVRAFTDDITGWGYISLVLESEMFNELVEGQQIPIIPYPVFEKIR